MKKLNNPYTDMKGFNCFGCSPYNDKGLNLDFYEDGEEIVTYWHPKKEFQGWVNILHGGIQSTLMDELASWVVFIQCKSSGVTANLNIKFKKPVYTTDEKLTIRGKLDHMHKRIAKIKVKLYNSEGICCTQGDIDYFVYPEKIARERFHYQGVDAYYSEEPEE